MVVKENNTSIIMTGCRLEYSVYVMPKQAYSERPKNG